MFLMKHGLGVIVAAALLVAGCQPGTKPAPVTLTQLDIPPGRYFGTAWMSDGSIVMAWSPDSGPSKAARLVRLSADRKELTTLPFAGSNSDCWRIEDLRPVRLSDDRLAFLRECSPREFEQTNVGATEEEIVALDLDTGAEETLARLGDPAVFGGSGRAIYSFSYPDGRFEGILSMGTGICEVVAAFDQDGIRPIEFELPGGGNLAEPFTLPCEKTVNASLAGWSPDGSRLAVIVSTEAKGRDGHSRLTAGWDLLVLDPGSGTSKAWLTGLIYPYALAWSPDGRWLVTAYETGGRSTTTLVSADEIVRLDLAERVADLTWSPDGTKLVGLVDPTPDGPIADLSQAPVIIDLSAALKAHESGT